MIRFLFLMVVLICVGSIALSDGGATWTLKKDENGIKVYTRPLKGYSYHQARTVTKMKSSLSAVVALLLDTERYPEWMYGCESVKTLKKISDTELYNYQVTGLPWPFDDRDVVALFKVTQDPATKVVTFSKTGMPDFIPDEDNRVRVRNFNSVTTLTPISKDSVLMVLEIHLDPGGNVPSWFYNQNLVNGPYETTLATVREAANYRHARVDFIKEY